MRHLVFSGFFLSILGIGGFLFTYGFTIDSSKQEDMQPIRSNKFSSENQIIDGPYLFHHGKGGALKEIVKTKAGVKVLTKHFHAKGLKNLTFDCTVNSLENESFQIKLNQDYKVPPSTYPAVKKLLAISDIEGNYYALRALLEGIGVMNKNHQWIFGDGHLVLVGDFFDRGDQVTAVLWLLYELDHQAKNYGGMVHFILGNHEAMNLRGDNRYTVNKYLETAKLMGIQYKELYGRNTELGRWLRTKNIVEKIGNILFVHGGMSNEIVKSGLTLDEINHIARKNLGLNSEQINKNGIKAQLVFGSNGPLWYRGYITHHELTKTQIPSILSHYGVTKIVIGHTPSKDISSIYKGEVCSIDVIQPISRWSKNSAKALLKEGDNYYKIDDRNKKVKLQ